MFRGRVFCEMQLHPVLYAPNQPSTTRRMTRILFEESIPQGEAYFSQLGDASSFHGPALSAGDLKGVDYLAVRSTTKVDSELLAQASELKLVTTATAGTNHLDRRALSNKGIPWRSAGGCNAVAVAEYVISVLMLAHRAGKVDLSRITVGVVGAGHVGTVLTEKLRALDIAFKLCDPPLQEQGDSRYFVEMDDIMTCDVITLHVPYVQDGPHATEHLIDRHRLAEMKASQLLINACRGEVIDEQALLLRLTAANAPTVVLDVYWQEPQINQALLPLVWLATPHIAGHTVEGKLRGTQMAYEHICEVAGKPVQLSLDDFLSQPPARRFAPSGATAEAMDWDALSNLLLGVYDIAKDDALFRRDTTKAGFLALRKNYPERRENAAHVLRLASPVSAGITRQLSELGFTLELI